MKYDQTFSKDSLSLKINRSDIHKDPMLSDLFARDKVVDDARVRLDCGFDETLKLKTIKRNGKKVYQLEELSDELILRKVAENINYFSDLKQTDRDSIVFNLLALLRETHPYKILRLDIKNFYESISTQSILLKVCNDLNFSRQTIQLLKSFFAYLKAHGIEGIPRGLSLSAVLSEFEMKYFDELCLNSEGVYFYQRFVDDIILILDSNLNVQLFQQKLTNSLPEGLSFNIKKTKIIEITRTEKKKGSHVTEKNLDFLGYRFCIYDLLEDYAKKVKSQRMVEVDISDEKKNKIKSRIIKAFLDYLKNGKLDLLADRIKFLTGNFSLLDRRNGIKRKSGIYYNYKYLVFEKSKTLKELDIFFRNILLVPKGKFNSKLTNFLSKSQMRNLLKNSFINGFKKRIFHYFSPKRLSEIQQCWKNA